MVIVYLSIALIVASIAYLGYSGFKIFKSAKPAINKLTVTAARVKNKTDNIKIVSTRLTYTKEKLKNDFLHKKQIINKTILAAKQIPKPVKQLWHRVRFVQHQLWVK